MRYLIAATLLLAGCATTQTATTKAEPCSEAAETGPDFRTVAEKIVTQVARVGEGDVVLLTGGPDQVPLLEELWVAARRKGARAMISLQSPEMSRRYYAEVPARFDASEPTESLHLADFVTVSIAVGGGDPSLIKEIPAERYAAVTLASRPSFQKWQARKARIVDVGNGLFPNAAMARQLGIDQAQLAEIFWAGIDVDYAELTKRGESVRNRLAGGKVVHLTHPNGTDLQFGIEGRDWIVSDGLFTEEGLTNGGTRSTTFLPAGEVYATTVPGTGSGKVVFDFVPYAGGRIENLTVVFEAGKVSAISADPSPIWDRWKAQYDAAPDGAGVLSWFDIGINPAVTPPAGSDLRNFVMPGVITVGLGVNTWAGGENDAPWGAFGQIVGGTVEVDGQAVVQGGELELAATAP